MTTLPDKCVLCEHLSISRTYCTLLTSLNHTPFRLEDSRQSPPDCCPLRQFAEANMKRKEKDEKENTSRVGSRDEE